MLLGLGTRGDGGVPLGELGGGGGRRLAHLHGDADAAVRGRSEVRQVGAHVEAHPPVERGPHHGVVAGEHQLRAGVGEQDAPRGKGHDDPGEHVAEHPDGSPARGRAARAGRAARIVRDVRALRVHYVAAPPLLGYGVQRHAGGDPGVERLQRAGHRYRHQLVAGLGDEPRETLALGADDDHERAVRQVQIGQGYLSVCRETDHHAARLLVGLQLAGQIDHLRHGHASGGTGRRLPGARRHARGTAFGDHHTVRPEARGGAYDGAEVARVGHRVERHDQRLLGVGRGGVDEVHRVCVLVRRHARGESLVHRAGGHPVELDAWHLEQGDALVGRDREDLAQPTVALGPLRDVHRRHGQLGAQRLHDGVAPGDPLVVAAALAHRATRTAAGHLLVTDLLLVGLVVRPVLRLGRGSLALQATTDATAGPGRRVALAGLLDRALALRVTWHPARSTSVRQGCPRSRCRRP